MSKLPFDEWKKVIDVTRFSLRKILLVLLIVSFVLPPPAPLVARGAAPNLLFQLFPPEPPRTLPAITPWGFPEFTGEPALQPLPDFFDIAERPAWFDGIPATIRPFPRPSAGLGGPDDNHADMYVFFYPDGTPVPQLPLLEAVPKNSFLSASSTIDMDVVARFFSTNWELHPVIVPQNYVPGRIKSILDLTNPALVLEDLQTNIFVNFPILPRGFNIPGLQSNNLAVEQGLFEGNTVRFVAYEFVDDEFREKPLYLFKKPSGEFAGAPVLSTIPGQPHYNSLWEVFFVQVPQDYVADSLRSEDAVLASGYPIRTTGSVFAPVESLDGKRTTFSHFMNVLTGVDGKFRKDRFPMRVSSPRQPYHNDPRLSQATLGFSSLFTFNEVDIPRIGKIPAAADADIFLRAALGEQVDQTKLLLPPSIARQLLVQDAAGKLTHLNQPSVDTMPLAETTARGQALFEREIFEEEGAGPAFNTYSCASCHGQPFIGGVEPTAGGSGKRYRNALQPSDTGPKVSRKTPHVFGIGIREQLSRELRADNPEMNPPLGWKGTVATVREFTAGPFKGELGMEAVEKVAEIARVPLDQAATLDLDKDGIVAEISVGDVTAVAAFMASLPRPFQVNASDPKVSRGRQLFEQVGCASCHTPVQTLKSNVLEIRNPQTAGVVRVPLGDPRVELYSDLKRHRMGPLLAEPGPQGGLPADMFRTPALWGLADSAPYLHDASANTIEEAVLKHGGQAQATTDAYKALGAGDKDSLLSFLNSLVLPRPEQLELDFYNRLTERDKGILAPVIQSFLRPIRDPLLVAWLVNPPPEGTGSFRGNLTIQASITSTLGLNKAAVIVDGAVSLPLMFNPASGFHEARLDTTRLSEGDHQLKLDVRDRSGQGAVGGIQAIINVDNIPNVDFAGAASGPGLIPPNAPVKVFDISAIDVVITVNRFGDNDPVGKMFVLDENIPAVRAQEGKALPDRVSLGLRDDPIQPLVIRANAGDVVRINFTNRLALGRASIQIAGLAANPRTSAGAFVGKNPDTMVDPGKSITYEWYVPDLPNIEGSYIFTSMGDLRQQQAHGLFGVINIESKGSIYLNPSTGQPQKSGWEAIIVDPNGKDFREDTIIYHEFGDEEFSLSDKNGNKLPDVAPVTKAYRPGTRLLNYRSEPFWRRLELTKNVVGIEDESQSYGSYMNGDPPTPMPRGYLGDPTKRRIVHAGSERFHMEHLHGGSIRWRFDPFVERDQWGFGLDKNPQPQSVSQRLDSQGIGPGEAYTIATEGGAGGLQAGAGEFLFHCHFPEHYVGGMWSFWRVFDTLQTAPMTLPGHPALVELPDRLGRTALAVDSVGLLGKVLPSGKTLTTGPTTATTRNIEEWVRSVLPSQGVPGNYDASVWDWTRQDMPGGPLYLGEPEDTRTWVAWASPTPGQRPRIMFNPKNGRPAFPLLRPHLGKRPPFAPGRSGSPWLGEPDADHPDSLMPASARRLEYAIVSVATPVTLNQKFNIVKPDGLLLMLDEDKEDILAGRKKKEQLTIRANVGDGVDIIQYSEIPDSPDFPLFKANTHIHFVQFDTQASDGVISGFSYEQSVRSYLTEGAAGKGIKLTAPAAAGSQTMTVDDASTLKVNAFFGVGFGVARNQPGGFEFARITAKNGNTLTLDRPLQKDHPAGQYAGVEFTRHQWFADVEEGTTFFHNHVFGIPGFGAALTGVLVVEPKDSTWHDPVTGAPVRSGTIVDIHTDRQVAPGVPIQNYREFVLHQMNAITGTEGEGGEAGGFNLRQEPLSERLKVNPDPSLLFSSVTHGDPATPLLRAYVGDLVALRLINSAGHDHGTFHLAGHRFRMERFDPREAPRDAITLGISERFDLFFTAGSVGLQPGDYVYTSGAHEKMDEGAWGILRVHDTVQPDLLPLSLPAPPAGAGFPRNATTGGRPPVATEPATVAELKTKLERQGYRLPASMPVRTFDVLAIQKDIDFSSNMKITSGRAYVLAEDEAAVIAGTKPLEPLVLRANVGEIVRVNFTNRLPAARASFHLPELVKTADSLGGAFGFNNDSTVAPGQSATYWYVIDASLEKPRSFVISDFGDPVSGAAKGLYGALVIVPAGSTFHDPKTGAVVKSGAVVDVRNPSLPGGGFRDVALIFHDDDHKMNRDVMPYRADVRGVTGINYRSEPFAERLAADAAKSRVFTTEAAHGDPRTPLVQATAGDSVRLHVLGGYGHHAHVFFMAGYQFPHEMGRSGGMNFAARQFGPMVGMDTELVGGAGGVLRMPGDYLFGDRRNPFLEGGMWGIFRVTPEAEAGVMPFLDLAPGWNLVSRNVIPANTSAAQFLAGIEGKFERVVALDPANPSRMVTFVPGVAGNTLNNLDQTMGFWIFMKEAAFLAVPGKLPSRTDVPLRMGWNLVAWPSNRSLPVAEALASIQGKYDLVFSYQAREAGDPWKRFDPAAVAFANDLTVIKPQLGYWIRMKEPGVLTVTNP